MSTRAAWLARGLLRTERAFGDVSLEYRMVRLECCDGGYYWISPNGKRLYRGKLLLTADKAPQNFIDAMARSGRRRVKSGRCGVRGSGLQ